MSCRMSATSSRRARVPSAASPRLARRAVCSPSLPAVISRSSQAARRPSSRRSDHLKTNACTRERAAGRRAREEVDELDDRPRKTEESPPKRFRARVVRLVQRLLTSYFRSGAAIAPRSPAPEPEPRRALEYDNSDGEEDWGGEEREGTFKSVADDASEEARFGR
eukprot:31058-Pelagococcus_subviridis.AAC.9